MIRVKCTVPVYELDGSAADAQNADELTISDHPTDDECVVVEYGCTKLTLNARDVIRAVKNAVRV